MPLNRQQAAALKRIRLPLHECGRAILVAIAFAILGGCEVSPLTQSQSLWSDGHFEEAVLLLQDAAKKTPDDRSLLAAYHRRRDQAFSQLIIAADSALTARHLEESQDLYQRALRLDPDSQRAKDGLERVSLARRLDSYLADATHWAEQGRLAAAEGRLRQVLAAEPGNHAAKRLLHQLHEREHESADASNALTSALATPVSVEFRDTPLRNVFEVLSRVGGLNFVFDHDVKTDSKITIFIRNNAIEDVLRVLLSTNGLEDKVLNDNTLLIYPNNAAKQKEYQDLVVRTFYLANTDAKQVETMLKTMAHIKDTFVDEKLNMLVIRDTPDAVRLAERMVDSADISESEVMLELEVVELSRTRALNLGIQLPSNVQRESTAPIDTGTTSTAAAAGRFATNNFASLITTLPNPLMIANLYAQDNDSNLLANPRIRVKNHEKAKVLIGEKLPVITSTAVQNAGVASSVSYIDVGLKLEVQPQIYLDDEVAVKIMLEVNSNLGAVTVGNSSTGVTTAYQVGTRSAETTLRLHDGETQVLAGLINDNESATWSKVPGISDLPGIGRLFSNDNSSHEKTEIVLLVTPHIVRTIATPDEENLTIPAGTDVSVGTKPLSIGPTAARSLSIRGAENATPGQARISPRLPNVPNPPPQQPAAGEAPAPESPAPAESAPVAPVPAANTPPGPRAPANGATATTPGSSFPAPPAASTPPAPGTSNDSPPGTK